MLQNRFLVLVILVFVEANRWIRLYEVEIDLVAEQFSDVGNAIPSCCQQISIVHYMYSLDHGRSLKTQTPPIYSHILGQTHWLQHLRSEHATVTDLNPLLETIMV
jgi:hypothetical protein